MLLKGQPGLLFLLPALSAWMAACGSRTVPLPCAIVEDPSVRAAWVGRWVKARLELVDSDNVTCLSTPGHPEDTRCYVLTLCGDGRDRKTIRLLSRHARAGRELAGPGLVVKTWYESAGGQRLLPGDYIDVTGPIASDNTESFFIDVSDDIADDEPSPADRETEARRFVHDVGAFRLSLFDAIERGADAAAGLQEAGRRIEAGGAQLRATYLALLPLGPPRIRVKTKAEVLEAAQEFDASLVLRRRFGDAPIPDQCSRAAEGLRTAYAAIFEPAAPTVPQAAEPRR